VNNFSKFISYIIRAIIQFQNIYIVQKVCLSPFSISFLGSLSAPGNHQSGFCLHRCVILEILYKYSFHVELLALSRMYLKFIYVVVGVSRPFFLNGWVAFYFIDPHFIYFPVFQHLNGMNKLLWRNSPEQVFLWLCFHFY
jgi:hypothetical protein